MPSLGSPIASGLTAEIFAWENGCILKLIRPGFPAHLANQEWEHGEAVWKLGARVPRPIELIEIDGRRGVVFERIEGPNMREAMQRSLWRLDPFARLLGRLHAELHALPAPASFQSLHDRIRWNLNQPTQVSDTYKTALLDLLDRLPHEPILCHGDFHPENILLAPTGPLIIDWEGSMQGSPAGDVARTCLWIRAALMFRSGAKGWLFRQLGRRFERVYLSEYQRIRGPLVYLEEWLAMFAACRMTEENRKEFPYLEQIICRAIPGLY